MEENLMGYHGMLIVELIFDITLIIELDDGKIYRKPLYLMVKTMVSCRFSLSPIQRIDATKWVFKRS